MSFRYPDGGYISAFYDPLQVPNAPTGVSATAGNQQATVSFTAPTNVGGSAITGYVVRSSPGGITATGSASPITVTGLTNGTSYTFNVAAVNSYGAGPFATSGSVTPTPPYIEEVFSTYLYTGTGTTLTITNNIDLSTNGGLVWIKNRQLGNNHSLFSSAVGGRYLLASNSSAARQDEGGTVYTPLTTGFRLLGDGGGGIYNSENLYTSWSFRKAEKFFDVVTYTGNGSSTQSISTSLGVAPSFIIIKKTSTTDNWKTFARVSDTTWTLVYLNLTNAGSDFAYSLISPALSSTAVDVGYISTNIEGGCNVNGTTYVMYLFAHNAGGFGASGTDNIISCGSYTGNGSASGPTVTLGYEPQWVMIRNSGTTGSWQIMDNMRGMFVGANENRLIANSSSAELSNNYLSPTATGFTIVSDSSEVNGNGNTIIYVAIRRGPMKTPTDATTVFSPILATDSESQGVQKTTNFPVDMQMPKARTGGNTWVVDRLRGISSNTTDFAVTLFANNTDAEYNNTFAITRYWSNTGYQISGAIGNVASVYWNFRRAPGFFDMVCYTGNSTAGNVQYHNLGVAPEPILTKIRNFTGEDGVASYYNGSTIIGGYWNNADPFAASGSAPSTDISSITSSSYTLNTNDRRVNGAYNYVAYLFATVAGVSKVGSYTGTATTLQINCGFTAGARFVLIKRTDASGGWYMWDSARGIVSGDDPYLLLNTTAAEVTNTDYVDTYSAGFEISSTAPDAINASGGTFIFLAIA